MFALEALRILRFRADIAQYLFSSSGVYAGDQVNGSGGLLNLRSFELRVPVDFSNAANQRPTKSTGATLNHLVRHSRLPYRRRCVMLGTVNGQPIEHARCVSMRNTLLRELRIPSLDIIVMLHSQ